MEVKSDQPATVDEYIAQAPESVRPILARIRAVIKTVAPQAEEKISYQMPGYFLNGQLVWFGAFKHHIGLYPRTDEMEAAFKGELSAYKASRGTLQFPLDKPIPYELIAKIVQFRTAENLRKQM